MKSLPVSLALSVALLVTNALPGQAPRHQVESQVVGPPWVQGMIYTQSPKGSRLASTYAKDGKWVVAIDNVEGELFDDILKTASEVVPEFNEADVIVSQSTPPPGPVAFSRDGSRYAYAGRQGEDVIVILDGKEVFRAKQSHVAPPVSLLQFSPDGKHLFFYNQTADTLQSSFRLMMDGKPVTPAFDGVPPIFFNADGSRWILNGGKAKQPRERLLVIDGKEQSYAAERARFSPDGKKVVCTTGGRGEQKLLVDGKVILDTKATIERFRVGATGDIAVITQKVQYDKNQLLFINGKPVAGVDGIRDIVFSPDGKRWAAHCTRDMNTVTWYVVDGKKHQEYKSVAGFKFSPDSSKYVYLAESGEKKFIVTNGEEDAGNGMFSGMSFASTGNILTYVAGPNYVFVHHDDKVSPQHRLVFGLALSPDGKRLGYFARDAETSDFMVDGEKKGIAGAVGGKIIFSPDSRHIAAHAWEKEGDTVYVDGEFLPARRHLGVPMEFTPDSRHLIVMGSIANGNAGSFTGYFLDGQEVARFSGRGVYWANSPTRIRLAIPPQTWGAGTDLDRIDRDAKDWEFQSGGRVVFLGQAASNEGYGPMTRITVTPAPETTFADWPTDTKAAMEKEAAEALAAKEKAAADKAAAAAKAKADAEAAAAAKAKARQDALDAKKKAQADAAAKKAKKP